MRTVMFWATGIAITCYILAGFFGFATFANYPDVDDIMEQENILNAPYGGNGWILLSQFLLLIGIVLATPLCLLPCKDTVEELFLGQTRRMTGKENFVCTLGLVTLSCAASIVIPNIGDVMTVVGATTNPLVGFSLPIVFYLKTDNSPTWSYKRIFAHFVNVVVILVGILSLTSFIIKKTQPSLILTN